MFIAIDNQSINIAIADICIIYLHVRKSVFNKIVRKRPN